MGLLGEGISIMNEIATAARKGAKLLDRLMPGWEKKINTKKATGGGSED